MGNRVGRLYIQITKNCDSSLKSSIATNISLQSSISYMYNWLKMSFSVEKCTVF